jgi:phenylacetic acid degradation protein paaN
MSSTVIDAGAAALFEKHRPTLEGALGAIRARAYWSAYPEVPSAKNYGENAKDEGEAAFKGYLRSDFALGGELAAFSGPRVGAEVSPYGFSLDVRYPKLDLDHAIGAAQKALETWAELDVRERVGIALEAIARLNARSFEIAFAAMHTTGQGFTMAFQAAGPHAQDRALEAIAYAYEQMSLVPERAVWEKPQGKNPSIRLEKHYHIVPRGVALVIGCSTFPTWNAYPGLFASLVTGNPVIVKPHPGAILPLAITVKIVRELLESLGFDPNVVQLAPDVLKEPITKQLAQRPEIAVIDYTGSSAFGEWLEREVRHAAVYTEKAGVNSVVLDSTDDFEGMARNLAFSLCLYSGQMCTTPQNFFIPREGISVGGKRVPFDAVVDAVAQAISSLLSDPIRAVEILGAIQNEATLARIESAAALGEVVLPTRSIPDARYPHARIRTPMILKTENETVYGHEHFGPISFVIPVADAHEGLVRAARLARERGAITGSVYSTRQAFLAEAQKVSARAGVPLSCNLLGNIYVNQTAAFSDFHVGGINPAGNAVLVDSAFVAGRYHVMYSRTPLG